MTTNSIIGVFFVLIFIFISISHAEEKENIVLLNYLKKELSVKSPIKFFNVLSYGAISDGKTDNSKAFQQAWTHACQSEGRNIMYIPRGNFMLNPITFTGRCKSHIAIAIKGVLKAPTSPSLFFGSTWIGFRYIDGITIYGGGVLDGQGASAWRYNDCKTNPSCNALPTTVRFDFVTGLIVRNIHSVNSKNTHFTIFASKNMNISGIRITAPDESPNTDGIKIAESSGIRISNSVIGTGDDCIAMLTGTQNIRITNVHCGPGHGISIGSMGNNYAKEFVTNVTVRNCTFDSTQNGLRIKTRPSSYPSYVSNIVFRDIKMINVNNPIIIDQQYCPVPPCYSQGGLGVKVFDVTFRNVRGTSSSKKAVILNCSSSNPCQNVKLTNIDLAYRGREGGRAISACANVNGFAYGKQSPTGCL